MKPLTKQERENYSLKNLMKSEISHLQKLADTEKYDQIIEWSQALIETAYTAKKTKYLKIITQLMNKPE